MRDYVWDEDKNRKLKEERDISFEEMVVAIESENLLTIRQHHNKKKYPNQKFFIVLIDNYVYSIPFVQDGEKYFLKTIFPSRKLTKLFLGGDKL